jgi:5-dehydro-2-deoxygluconokinase
VLLGLSAPIEELARGFADAAGSVHCRGFAVGRTIFHDPARAWLLGALDDAGLVSAVRRNFETLIDAWTETRSRGDGQTQCCGDAARRART